MACIHLCSCWSPTGKSSTTDHSSSNVNGDTSVSKSHVSLANGYICKDCSLHSQEMDSLITRSSSSSSPSSQAAEASTAALSLSSSPFTSVYSRDRSQRSKTGEKQSDWSVTVYWIFQTCSSQTISWGPICEFSCGNENIIGSGLSPGVLVSISKTCMRYSKRALAPVVSLVTLLFHNVLWLGSRAKSPPGKGIHQEMFFVLFIHYPSFSLFLPLLVPVGLFP